MITKRRRLRFWVSDGIAAALLGLAFTFLLTDEFELWLALIGVGALVVLVVEFGPGQMQRTKQPALKCEKARALPATPRRVL